MHSMNIDDCKTFFYIRPRKIFSDSRSFRFFFILDRERYFPIAAEEEKCQICLIELHSTCVIKKCEKGFTNIFKMCIFKK